MTLQLRGLHEGEKPYRLRSSPHREGQDRILGGKKGREAE